MKDKTLEESKTAEVLHSFNPFELSKDNHSSEHLVFQSR